MARLQRPVRTNVNVTPETPTGTKTTEYKGCLIENVEQQGFHVTYVTITGNRRRARNIEHAKQMVDSLIATAKEPELRPGGWIKDPPLECTHQRIDREGLWAECVICAFFCMKHSCPAYVLMMGTKRKETTKTVAPVVEPVIIATVETPRINRRRR
jgi:hypothetical protein